MNEMLMAVPSPQEAKAAVFGLSQDSVAGPDGFNGVFLSLCLGDY